MKTPPPALQQRGATLIEVMVSALIVSFGILAMIALQSNAIKFNKTSEYRSIATLLANDLADRMRVNAAIAVAKHSGNAYDMTTAYSKPSSVPARTDCLNPNNCSAEELAARDLGEWQRALYFALPGGSAYVQANQADRVVDTWVAWVDPAETAAPGATGECPTNFVAATATVQPRCMFFRIALPTPVIP
ncbi:MAG: type IV pilus modification protein PilV [Burkholderiales bacterium]|nr:type IV pilus modification protein PilV [Burkholderiales bacterium]